MVDPTRNLPQPPSVLDVNMQPPESPASEEDMSNSPFAQMFRGGATKQQVKQFINLFLKNVVLQIKKSDEVWKRSQKRLRDVIDGKKLDC
jgi:hypothetical protein